MRKKLPRKRPMLKAAIYGQGYSSLEDFVVSLDGPLNEQQLSAVINGRRKLSRGEMGKIAQALNTPMSLLFPGEIEG